MCLHRAAGPAGVDLHVGVDADADLGLDADADLGLDADVDLGLDADVDLGLDADVDLGVDADVDLGLDADADLGLDADVDLGLDADVDLGVDGDVDLVVCDDVRFGVEADVGLNVDLGFVAADVGCGDGEAEGVEDLIEDVDLEVEVDWIDVDEAVAGIDGRADFFSLASIICCRVASFTFLTVAFFSFCVYKELCKRNTT